MQTVDARLHGRYALGIGKSLLFALQWLHNAFGVTLCRRVSSVSDVINSGQNTRAAGDALTNGLQVQRSVEGSGQRHIAWVTGSTRKGPFALCRLLLLGNGRGHDQCHIAENVHIG